MIQIYPDSTLLSSLAKIITNGSSLGLWWWLFNNNVTPSSSSVLGTFNAETALSTPGIFVAFSAFTGGLAGHVAKYTAIPDIVFTNPTGSPLSEFGYFVTDAISGSSPSGNLVLATLFDSAPVAIAASGGTLNVTPTLSLKASS